MAIKALRGKSYSFRDGLSDESSDWFVVGKIFAPIRIDKVLGWRDPNLHKPTYTQSVVYLVLPAEYNETEWVNISNDAYLVPMFAVEEVLETSTEGRMPLVIEAPIFKDVYMIELEYATYQIMDVNVGPIRMDKILDWRDPETDEQPTYILGDTGVCVPTTISLVSVEVSEGIFEVQEQWVATNMFTTSTPLFLISKVYTWQSDCQCDTSLLAGPQGPVGAIGPQGPKGSTGATGTTAGATGGVILSPPRGETVGAVRDIKTITPRG